MVLVLLVMPMHGVDWLVRLDVGVAWIAALSTLLLVPADVSHTLQVLWAGLEWAPIAHSFLIWRQPCL